MHRKCSHGGFGGELHLAVKTCMFDQEAGPNRIRAVYLIAGVEPCRTKYQFSMYWLVSVLKYNAFVCSLQKHPAPPCS